MNHTRFSTRRPQGIALIIVVLMLVLMVGLLMAIFSVSDNELSSARTFANGQQSKQLSDVAINAAISQLRQGTTPDPFNEGTEIWTSQPGLIRKYNTTGDLHKAYKLYSSSSMVIQGGVGAETRLLSDAPPLNWRETPQRYVDLNRPVLSISTSGNPSLRFPIVDPRAMTGNANTVAGFGYSQTLVGGGTVAGVVTSGGDAQRLPMPVEWLYVLRDGSLGTVNDAGIFSGTGIPSETNPITGRIAFWTDDESSKVNVNTASEPTAWSLPTFYHTVDAAFARYQPTNGEFQRYPGHPATTALSPILFPGVPMTTETKEQIYNLVPKIGPGGSKSGTIAYDDETIARVSLATYRSEHLYANLDEFALARDRSPNQLGGVPLSFEDIERKNFFLTAQSRAPESNLFGLPKIAIWPVSYRGPDYQTSFDRMIAFCSTLRNPTGTTPYYFQRGWADSPTDDIQQPSNLALINYLNTLLSMPIPGFSATGEQNLVTKYGDDVTQIIVEIFDYVRSTNLHDSQLIKPGDKVVPDNPTQHYMLGYAPNSSRATNFKTFTDPRFFAVDPDSANEENDGLKELLGFPGHGQVTPSRLKHTANGVDKEFQGIARFPTISEAGLHFICAADNTDDDDNPFPLLDPRYGKPGGGRARKISAIGKAKAALQPTDFWYSNFPPQPNPNPAKNNPPNLSLYPNSEGFPYGKDPTHPGYDRVNWNHQLAANTPLKPGFRRVQAKLLLEFFIPAAGFTITEPELTVKVTGLNKFKLNGTQLFPRDVEVFRTARRATHPGAQMDGGYGVGLKGLLRGREAPARTPMPADANWGLDDWEVKPTALPGDELCVLNYDLLSNFIDINVGNDGSLPMEVGEGDLQVEIYSGHLGRIASKQETQPTLVQTLLIPFPRNVVKAPTLVRNPIEGIVKPKEPAAEPAAWWTFYSRGCMGIDNMDSIVNRSKLGPQPFAETGDPDTRQARRQAIRGRHFQHNFSPRIGNEPRRGALFYGFDAADAGAPRLFRPQQATGGSQTVINEAEEKEGSDVVQTITLRYGDPRMTAAQPVVGKDQWRASRHYGQRRLAHTFTNFVSDHMPGYDYGGESDFENRLVPNTKDSKYPNHRLPKLPFFEEAVTAAQLYGDFDNGVGQFRDGPYINKPDDGNLSTKDGVAYLGDAGSHLTAGERFFSPNRMVPSPVMFGSLPTGVKSSTPWRTLLFRPQANHYGAGSAFDAANPPDHIWLEFFWMPVIEPYAISEPFSTAGKVNLNYQIFPFTNIRRASGLHAVLAGGDIAAIPNSDLANYKVWPEASNKERFWGSADGKTWHYPIDAEKTLQQFESKFSRGEAFISPSQICDVHLVPAGTVASADQMEEFWSTHRPTGDNTRERPYAAIYPRLTTRSNTFRVHFIAQSITKARSSGPNTVDTDVKVNSEQRGSALIERFLDPQEKRLPDFSTLGTTTNLDAYHHFRVIETKKFGS